MLAQMSNGAPQTTRQMAVEIGYILKKELDIVKEIESPNHHRTPDMQGLINDNVQLFNENRKLLNENMELKTIIESRVNSIAAKMQSISGEVNQVNQLITSLR
jgi:hypothetical protein